MMGPFYSWRAGPLTRAVLRLGGRRSRHFTWKMPQPTQPALENGTYATHEEYSLHPIGHIRSALRSSGRGARQGSEGAPDAWLEVHADFARDCSGSPPATRSSSSPGFIVRIAACSRCTRVATREIPLAGVFATRSPDRPNPLGLHRVTVREISGTRLRIGPIEAIDGTPVVDVKPVLANCHDRLVTQHQLLTAWFVSALYRGALFEASSRGNVRHRTYLQGRPRRD